MSWKDFDVAALVMRAMLVGPWKNAEEVEESLCLPELIELLKVNAEREYAERKFMAALKGIELPDPEADKVPTFEEVQERAKRKMYAQRTGKSEEEVDLLLLGLDYEG